MLKIYFNETIVNQIKPSGYEFSFCSHLMHNVNFNQPRFKPVLDNGSKYIIRTNAQDADYHLMPYKWSESNQFNPYVIQEARENNKKILVSYIDDSQPNINIEDSIILKANIDKNKIKENEICVPVYPNTNYFDFKYFNSDITVGFCGQVDKPTMRKEVCDIITKDYKTNFIFRDKFHWFYNESELKKMRDEYTNNFYTNNFSIAIRGVGNFSYRLCEIMHFGRIPIIITTNNILPLEKFINWNKCGIICDESELIDLNKKINDFVKTNDIYTVQLNNRTIWDEWLSPLGFTKNLKNILENVITSS